MVSQTLNSKILLSITSEANEISLEKISFWDYPLTTYNKPRDLMSSLSWHRFPAKSGLVHMLLNKREVRTGKILFEYVLSARSINVLEKKDRTNILYEDQYGANKVVQ